MAKKVSLQMCSPEWIRLINEVRIRYIRAGKKPPSHAAITKFLIQKKEVRKFLENEFIPI